MTGAPRLVAVPSSERTAVLISADPCDDVRNALSSVGLSVKRCTPFEGAAERLALGSCALAVVDCAAPGSAKLLQMLTRRQAPPFVALLDAVALEGEAGDQLEAFTEHAIEVIVRPCGPRQLALRLRSALARAGHRESRGLDLDPWTRNVPNPVLVLNSAGAVLVHNNAAAALFGDKGGDIGRHFEDLLPARYDAARRSRLTGRLLRSARARVHESQIADATGREFPAELLVVPLQLDGQVCFGVQLRDIGSRRTIEEELAQLASFPEFDPNPQVEFGEDGEVEYMNPAAEMLEEEGRLQAMLSGVVEARTHGEGSGGSYVSREIQIDDRWYEQHIHYIATWKCTRVYAREITERKRAERGLIEARDNLELRVRARTADLAREVEIRKRAEAAANEANRAKSVFLANMSHELRTPLNAIIGYGELLLEDIEEPQVRGDVVKIEVAARQLLFLINDILDISKIESGKMDVSFSMVDVPRLVREATGTVEILIENGGNTLALDIRGGVAPVRADEAKLRQVLTNLLSNASKFTKRGTITVSVGYQRRGPIRKLRIAVTDTGIGIAPDRINNLFEPFVQAERSTARRFGGTGLGLAICKEFCRMMGAEIGAESTPGEGSTFYILLPASSM